MSKKAPCLLTALTLILSFLASGFAQKRLTLKPLTNVELKLKVSVPDDWACKIIRDEVEADEDEPEEVDATAETFMLCTAPGELSLYLVATSEVDEQDAYPDSPLLWSELGKEKLPQIFKNDENVKMLDESLHIEPGHENGINGAFVSGDMIVTISETEKKTIKMFAFLGRNKGRLYAAGIAMQTERADEATMDLGNKILDTFAPYDLSLPQMIAEIQGVWEMSFNKQAQATLQVKDSTGTLRIKLTNSDGSTSVIDQNVTLLDAAKYNKVGDKLRGLYLLGSKPVLAGKQEPASNYSQKPDELLFQKKLDGSYQVWRSFKGDGWKKVELKSHKPN